MVLGALVGLKSNALGTVFGGFGSLSRAARAKAHQFKTLPTSITALTKMNAPTNASHSGSQPVVPAMLRRTHARRSGWTCHG
jgi:hypothetical protein